MPEKELDESQLSPPSSMWLRVPPRYRKRDHTPQDRQFESKIESQNNEAVRVDVLRVQTRGLDFIAVKVVGHLVLGLIISFWVATAAEETLNLKVFSHAWAELAAVAVGMSVAAVIFAILTYVKHQKSSESEQQ